MISATYAISVLKITQISAYIPKYEFDTAEGNQQRFLWRTLAILKRITVITRSLHVIRRSYILGDQHKCFHEITGIVPVNHTHSHCYRIFILFDWTRLFNYRVPGNAKGRITMPCRHPDRWTNCSITFAQMISPQTGDVPGWKVTIILWSV